MWEIIKPIIYLLCNLVLIFLYGIPAIMVGIYQIKEEYESTRWGHLWYLLGNNGSFNGYRLAD